MFLVEIFMNFVKYLLTGRAPALRDLLANHETNQTNIGTRQLS